jgi:predicted ATP-dependent protease
MAHLMLRDDVIAAVEAGRFHIYAIRTVDQGIEVLTGLSAGVRGGDGRFPDASVNGRVEARLLALAEKAKAFRASGGDTRKPALI